jgi:hypothetical protein
LVPLPASSPHLNLIEGWWKFLTGSLERVS